MDEDTGKPGFFERLFNRMTLDTPESTADMLRLLQLARDNKAVDPDTSALLEKVLAFAELEVRDVMITRSQMDVIKIDDTPKKIVDYVIDTAHSRFPVIGEDRDEILGVLHAKDLLRFFKQPDSIDIKPLLRETVFVPESKSLNTLLKEFRDRRIHLAMVVDEYGGISGLVTFEDILEAIIGDIEDEFDEEEDNHIVPIGNDRYRINAITEIAEFNEFFDTDFSDEDVDTVGGLLISKLGRLPERGEKIVIDDWQFTVARVDHRRLHILIATQNENNIA